MAVTKREFLKRLGLGGAGLIGGTTLADEYMPTKNRLPPGSIGDPDNPNFGKKEGQDITCWNLLQLATESVKSAYIDRFVSRNNACVGFSCGIQKALNGEDTEGYSWFLS